MKKLFLAIFTLFFVTLTFSQDESLGKAFEKKKMYNQLGFGVQPYFTIPAGANFGFNFLYQAEWGIGKYVGLGFHAGTNLRPYRKALDMLVQVGMQGNFHFYQLIDDKVSKNLHADKLDIYGGLNLGGGPGFSFSKFYDTEIYGGWYIGPQVGVKYYPSKHFGLFAEVGYGKALTMIGIVLK